MKKLLLSFFALIMIIRVNAQITLNPSNGCAPLFVNASSITFGGAVTYDWSVDGTSVATGQNTSFTITQVGWHNVDMSARDGNGNLVGSGNYIVTVNGF